MFYKKGDAVGIRKRGRVRDPSGKLGKDDLMEIGTACRRKLQNGESTEGVRACATEPVRAKAAAVG